MTGVNALLDDYALLPGDPDQPFSLSDSAGPK